MKISDLRASCPSCGNFHNEEFAVEKDEFNLTDPSKHYIHYRVACSCGASGSWQDTSECAVMEYQKKFGLPKLSEDPIDLIKSMRKMRYITRFTGKCLLQPPNVAEHGQQVAGIFIILSKYWGIPISVDSLDFVVNHDLFETETGDLPYDVKHFEDNEQYWDKIEETVLKKYPHLSRYTDSSAPLSNDEKWLFRMADAIEGMMTCIEEQRMGNKTYVVEQCRMVYHSTIEKLCKGEAKLVTFIERLEEHIREN